MFPCWGAARARGKRVGRPRKLDAKKKTQALTLHDDKTNTIADICRTLGVGRTTLYRYLAEGRTDDKWHNTDIALLRVSNAL